MESPGFLVDFLAWDVEGSGPPYEGLPLILSPGAEWAPLGSARPGAEGVQGPLGLDLRPCESSPTHLYKG